MKRRAFIAGLGSAAAWPVVASAQQPAMPMVAFINAGTADAAPPRYLAAFRKGLREAGYVEGRNVMVEYHWLEGHHEGLPRLMADLIHRQVALIATPGSITAALAAKAATATVPIVFGSADDPVKLGLVASLARPASNATGVNFLAYEVAAKQLGLLHELVPDAVRIAMLINPRTGISAERTLHEMQEAARALRLEIKVLKAGSADEIDAAFLTLARERADALSIQGDAVYASRRVQLATLAIRERIPTGTISREMVEAGLLMSYGSNIADMFRQVGIYTGSILKGTKPDDLPVIQSTKLEFVINLQTAKSLGLSVSPMLLARADEVIE